MSRTTLRLQALEARDVPNGTQLFAVAEDGGASRVAVYQAAGEIVQEMGSTPESGLFPRVLTQQGNLLTSFSPYPGFGGGVRVAVGDVTGDGVDDVITGAGAGGGPHVKIYDGASLLTGWAHEVGQFFAFDSEFHGGVFVAVGQMDPATPQKEIIVGADEGGGPHVRVFAVSSYVYVTPGHSGGVPPVAFTGYRADLASEFFAYDAGFHGGVRVAAADVNGDGRDDVVTGAGPGGGPHVRVFNVNPPDRRAPYLRTYDLLDEFFAYDKDFHGGVYVAAGNVAGDAKYAEIVTGAGEGGGPDLKVFSREAAGKMQLESEVYLAAPETYNYLGIRVGLADLGNNSAAASLQTRPLTIYVSHSVPKVIPWTGPGPAPLYPPLLWPQHLTGYNYHFGDLQEVSIDLQPVPFDGDQGAGWFSGQ